MLARAGRSPFPRAAPCRVATGVGTRASIAWRFALIEGSCPPFLGGVSVTFHKCRSHVS